MTDVALGNSFIPMAIYNSNDDPDFCSFPIS